MSKIDLQTPSYQEQYRRILNYGASSSYTEDERDDIIDPIDGQTVYNTDTNQIDMWNGTEWVTDVSQTNLDYIGSYYRSTVSNIATGTETSIAMTATIKAGSKAVLTSGYYIAQVTGWYDVGVNLYWGSQLASQMALIRVNGVSVVYGNRGTGRGSSANRKIYVSSGNSIAAGAYQSSGSTQALTITTKGNILDVEFLGV